MSVIQYNNKIEAIKFRENLALTLPKGNGIEWGALYWPTPVSSEHKILFADYKHSEDSKKFYFVKAPPLEQSSGFVKLDLVIPFYNLPKESSNLDFFIAFHVMEHYPNLVEFLKTISDILNDNGEALIAVPDADQIFDRNRTSTTLSDVIFNFNFPNYSVTSKLSEHIHMVENIDNPSEIRKRIDVIKAEQEDPHLWVFRKHTFLPLLKGIFKTFDINLIVTHQTHNPHFNEIIVKLKHA